MLSVDGSTSEEEEGSKAGQSAKCSKPLLETKGNLCPFRHWCIPRAFLGLSGREVKAETWK